jgi:hypothetical protein
VSRSEREPPGETIWIKKESGGIGNEGESINGGKEKGGETE